MYRLPRAPVSEGKSGHVRVGRLWLCIQIAGGAESRRLGFLDGEARERMPTVDPDILPSGVGLSFYAFLVDRYIVKVYLEEEQGYKGLLS